MSFPCEVRARAAYTARNAQEMSLEAGQHYQVTDQDPTGQWFKTQGPSGGALWIPVSYVERISASTPSGPPVPSGRGRPSAGAGGPSGPGGRGAIALPGLGGGPLGRASPSQSTGEPPSGRGAPPGMNGPPRSHPSMSGRGAPPVAGRPPVGGGPPLGAMPPSGGAPPGRSGPPVPGRGGPPPMAGRASPPIPGGGPPIPGGPPVPGRGGPPPVSGGPPIPGRGGPPPIMGGPPGGRGGAPPIAGGPPGRGGPPPIMGGPPGRGGPPPIAGAPPGRGGPPPIAGAPPGRGGPPGRLPPPTVSAPPVSSRQDEYEIDDSPEERGYKWGSVADRRDNAYTSSVADKKTPKPVPPKPMSPGLPQSRAPLGYSGVGPWSCEKCNVSNEEWASSCNMCGAGKPDVVIEGPWECRSCRTKNKEQLLNCTICGSGKPDPQSMEVKPRGPVVDHIQAAYGYVPPVVQEKKVDPNDPFGDIEIVEWK